MHEFGILIPLFALSIPIIAIWTKHQQRLAQMGITSTARESAEKAAQYVGRVDDLEQRLRVLERIVTDKGYDVATQIEALRDTRRIQSQLDDGSKVQ
ncbi:MAG: hypothetical protein ABIT09_10930 [Croceibacterium sp.]